MVNVRHYMPDGQPAFLTVWRTYEDAPWVLVRLHYARTPGFAEMWAAASEWADVVLDVVVDLGT